MADQRLAAEGPIANVGDDDNDAPEGDAEGDDTGESNNNPPIIYPEFLPPGVLAVDDPNRMQITAGEHQMALRIKQAIADNPDIDTVSDYMCAQLALVDGVDIEHSLDRLYKIQCFREEYNIRDTVEEGVKIIAEYMKLMPAFHLCFTYDADRGNYVSIFDQKRFIAAGVSSEKGTRCWLGASYYTVAMLCPDLEAIRKGAVLVAECEGYDWKQNYNVKSLKRVWSEIGTVFPCNWSKIKYFNSGVMMNLLAATVRPVLPEGLKARLEFGCQYEHRLDTLYLVPTRKAADARLLARAEQALRTRHSNIQTFTL